MHIIKAITLYSKLNIGTALNENCVKGKDCNYELILVLFARRYCCESKVQPCDLAFMLSDRCYLVKCYSEERCQAIPAAAIDHSFKQKMAFVAPWLYQKGKKVGK